MLQSGIWFHPSWLYAANINSIFNIIICKVILKMKPYISKRHIYIFCIQTESKSSLIDQNEGRLIYTLNDWFTKITIRICCVFDKKQTLTNIFLFQRECRAVHTIYSLMFATENCLVYMFGIYISLFTFWKSDKHSQQNNESKFLHGRNLSRFI